LCIFPEIQGSISAEQFQEIASTNDKVYLDWEYCLLRVWTRIFGNEQTKRDADENKFGYGGVSYWEDSSRCMKDGELLHIAIEVGSYVGVKATAWAGMMKWTNMKEKLHSKLLKRNGVWIMK